MTVPSAGSVNEPTLSPRACNAVVETRSGAIAEPTAFLLELRQVRIGEHDALPVDDLRGPHDEEPLDVAAERVESWHADIERGLCRVVVVERKQNRFHGRASEAPSWMAHKGNTGPIRRQSPTANTTSTTGALGL